MGARRRRCQNAAALPSVWGRGGCVVFSSVVLSSSPLGPVRMCARPRSRVSAPCCRRLTARRIGGGRQGRRGWGERHTHPLAKYARTYARTHPSAGLQIPDLQRVGVAILDVKRAIRRVHRPARVGRGREPRDEVLVGRANPAHLHSGLGAAGRGVVRERKSGVASCEVPVCAEGVRHEADLWPEVALEIDRHCASCARRRRPAQRLDALLHKRVQFLPLRALLHAHAMPAAGGAGGEERAARRARPAATSKQARRARGAAESKRLRRQAHHQGSSPQHRHCVRGARAAPAERPVMTGGMLELSEDESGEELLPEESDYRAIPELDRYDADMLDDRPRAQSSRRELSARQRAEEVMSARDAQQRRGIVGRGGEHGAHAGGNAASGRGPRALEQVKANRTSNLELARLGAALKCPDAVVAKAEGYLRKAYTGARCLSNGTQLASLPAACLEIAARVCKKPVARDALLRKAGVHEKDVPNYTRALAHCHCLLGE